MEIKNDEKNSNKSCKLVYACCCSKIVQAFLLVSFALAICILPTILNLIFPATIIIATDSTNGCKIPTAPINNRSEPCPVYNGYPTESVSGYKTPAIMNLALGQRVYAVSLKANDKLCNLVDGNKNSEYTLCDCCISTNSDVGVPKWMIVDLVNLYRIDKMLITSAHGLANTLEKIFVGLLMSYDDGLPIIRGNYPICGQSLAEIFPTDTFTIKCKYGNKGRFVILEGTRDDSELLICEVEIFGSLPNCTNIYADLKCNVGYLNEYYCNVRYTGKTFPDQLDLNCSIAAGYPDNFKNPVPVNLALGRNVMTSSLEGSSNLPGTNKACNAVDGNALGDFSLGSCVSTNFNNGIEWVMVDLQNSYNISEIIISNRLDARDDNLDKVHARILSSYNTGQTITTTTGLFCIRPTLSYARTYIAKISMVCYQPVTGRYVAVVRDGGINFCEIEVYGIANY